MNTDVTKVLLVEDSVSDADILQAMLRQSGSGRFEFTCAESMEQALASLRQRAFDVVLLDLSLPDSTGESTFLRVREAAPQMPLVVLTSGYDEALGVEAIRHGVQDYLVKRRMDGLQIARAIRYAIERQQAEKTLRLSEEKFSAAFAQNPAVMAITRLEDGTFLDVNDSLLALTGYSRDELIGQSARQLPLWPSADAAARFVAELREKGSVRGWEQEFRKKSGEIVVTQLWAQVLTVHGEQVILSAMVDITERKWAERLMAERGRELAAIYEGAPLLMLLVDGKFRVRKANKEAELFAAASVTDLLGRHSGEALGCLYAQDDPGGCGAGPHCEHCVLRASLQHTLETGQTSRLVEASLPFLIDGRRQDLTFLFSTTAIAVDGERRVLVTMQDITARIQAEQHLAAHYDALARLHKLGSLFVEKGNTEQILGEIVDAAIAISGADFGNIQLLNPESGNLQIAAQRGFPQWWIDFWNEVTAGHGTCGTALKRGERVIVEDVEHCPIFVGTPALEMQLKAGVRAVQSTPLVGRSGRLLGMFSTHYKTPHRSDDGSLRLLDLLARHAADIIERMRAEEELQQAHDELEQRVEQRTVELRTANEELKRALAEQRRLEAEVLKASNLERQRIGRDLHEGLMQHLSGICYLGEALQEKLARREKPETGELTRMTQLLRDAIAQARGLVYGLDPVGAEPEGLTLALERLAGAVRGTFNVSCRLETPRAVAVENNTVANHLYRIAQEAVQNAIDHGGAKRVTMKLHEVDNRITLEIRDNGVGLDELMDGHTGMGLHIMQYRARACGGSLTIRRGPRGGTWVICSVPRPEPENAGKAL
jgi:PAS domain S-box-containing protein